jgi:hypothetical protein
VTGELLASYRFTASPSFVNDVVLTPHAAWFTDSTNRVIKTIARDAYGFRNPENQRLRTRCATTRRARGHLNPA